MKRMLQVGILLVVLLSLRRISGRPSWKDGGRCGSGLACGPECQNLCLIQHNYYRALHNLPPLRCDPDLAESAQVWTDMQAQKGKLKRSPWRNLGQVAESISWKQWGWEGMADTRAAVPSAVRSWYSERKGSIANRTATREHYQTIVHPDITRLGCGLHVIPGDGTYVTSDYGTLPGGKVLNDETQIPAAKDPEPACHIKSGQREKCGNISSPFMTPDVCLKAGCCYDDVFMDEPEVNWYSNEGSTWCFKGKKHDRAQQTTKSNDLEKPNSKTKGTSGDCYGDSCYSFIKKGKSWTENRQECKKKGGDLVSIETNGEWKFLKDKIQGLTNALKNEWHIGLKKEGSTWKWVNGAPLTINRWQVTEGQPSGDGPYVVMAKNYPPGTKGLFNDLPGWISRGFICEEKNPGAPSGGVGGIGDNCYGNSCYSFNERGKSWTENREECKKQRGDLVSIETDDEWTFLKDKIQGLSNPLRNEWHIGLKQEGSTWKWVNGDPLTISHWQRRQPTGDGIYVVMAKNFPPGTHGGFNDLPDWILSGYICETKVAKTWPTMLPPSAATSATTTYATVDPNFISTEPTSSSSHTTDGTSSEDNDCYGSSCYSFNTKGRRWTENREDCRKRGGDLVSLETDGEWAFMKAKIQGLSNDYYNEWHIGLTKVGSTWKWVSGAPLTIKRWQRRQPSGDGPYALIAKNYPPGTRGRFNDLPDRIYRAYICEVKQAGEKTWPTLAVGTTPTGRVTSPGLPGPPTSFTGPTPAGPPGSVTSTVPSPPGTVTGAVPSPPGTVAGTLPSPPGTVAGTVPTSPSTPGPPGPRNVAADSSPGTATGTVPSPPGTLSSPGVASDATPGINTDVTSPGPPGTAIGPTLEPSGIDTGATSSFSSTSTGITPDIDGISNATTPIPSGKFNGPTRDPTVTTPGPTSAYTGATRGPPSTITGPTPDSSEKSIATAHRPSSSATGTTNGPPSKVTGPTPDPSGAVTDVTPDALNAVTSPVAGDKDGDLAAANFFRNVPPYF